MPCYGNFRRKDGPWGGIKQYLQSAYGGATNRNRFTQLKTFCMFLGYARSGTSLLGSLLDAHPHIVIAHELDVLWYVQARFHRHQIFHLLLENSAAHAQRGRQATGYHYMVQDQWQGEYTNLYVIGDKKAGKSSLWLRKRPALLGKLRKTIGLPVRVFHVVRNPYDNIATKYCKQLRRGPTTLHDVIEQHFAQCQTVSAIQRELDTNELLEIRHEAVIADPGQWIRKMCEFLEVECPVDYVNRCAHVVYRTPHKSRNDVHWTLENIEVVRTKMEPFRFLDGYCFEQ